MSQPSSYSNYIRAWARVCMIHICTYIRMCICTYVGTYDESMYVMSCHAMPCHVMSSKVMCFNGKECQVKYAYSAME